MRRPPEQQNASSNNDPKFCLSKLQSHVHLAESSLSYLAISYMINTQLILTIYSEHVYFPLTSISNQMFTCRYVTGSTLCKYIELLHIILAK